MHLWKHCKRQVDTKISVQMITTKATKITAGIAIPMNAYPVGVHLYVKINIFSTCAKLFFTYYNNNYYIIDLKKYICIYIMKNISIYNCYIKFIRKVIHFSK